MCNTKNAKMSKTMVVEVEVKELGKENEGQTTMSNAFRQVMSELSPAKAKGALLPPTALSILSTHP